MSQSAQQWAHERAHECAHEQNLKARKYSRTYLRAAQVRYLREGFLRSLLSCPRTSKSARAGSVVERASSFAGARRVLRRPSFTQVHFRGFLVKVYGERRRLSFDDNVDTA